MTNAETDLWALIERYRAQQRRELAELLPTPNAPDGVAPEPNPPAPTQTRPKRRPRTRRGSSF